MTIHWPALRSLHIRNLLSFGPDTKPVELQHLNLLIGSNGSGKSNLIEAVGLLRATPVDLADAVRLGGGVLEWLWKGSGQVPHAMIETIVSQDGRDSALRYRIEFTRSGYRLDVTDERIENEHPSASTPEPFFAYSQGRRILSLDGGKRRLHLETLNPQLSILSQRKDPDQYPELTFLGVLFDSIRLYRDWEFGGLSKVRDICSADSPNEHLEQDASNLGLVLGRLLAVPGVNKELLGYLKLFYADAVNVHATINQGSVETRLEERHLKSTVPLQRLSDGTLRWLALLAVLLDPAPPPVVCIEEPELGLHPDMIPELAKLLKSAASRMQLIVATHSADLIEEFSESPEAVLVCEKEMGASTFRRLQKNDLAVWLKEYSLGQLWRQGQLGGNRW